jgi:uncharacterized membrane protein
MSKLKSCLVVVWAALSISALVNFSSAGEAHADAKLCNSYSKGIWVALTKPDSTCSGSPWRSVSWFHVPAGGQCITMFSESPAFKTYFYYVVAEDGQEWTGGQGTWVENWSNGSAPPVSECFTSGQARCTSPTSCFAKNHLSAAIGNSQRWTLTIAR